MKTELNVAWIKAAGVRAAKTFCQTIIAMVGVGSAISEVDWKYVLSCSVVAMVLSVCTSVVGLPEVSDDGETGSVERDHL